MKPRSYIVTIKSMKRLDPQKSCAHLMGDLPSFYCGILQDLDVVMKDNLARNTISTDWSFT